MRRQQVVPASEISLEIHISAGMKCVYGRNSDLGLEKSINMTHVTKQVKQKCSKLKRALPVALALLAGPAFADPVGSNGYNISVFAQGTASYSHPDSIAVVGNSAFVTYTNNVAPDGSDGKSSTIVQYNMNGSVLNQYSALGSNDGLKYNSSTGTLWAAHNEDGNAFVTLLNPMTGQQSQQYAFSAAPHGGGYDDISFLNGKTYVSASNPSVNAGNQVNGAPSIASVQLQGTKAVVTGVLANNAMATNIATGATIMTNQTDPDSMTTTPKGGLVLDSQGDGQLLFVNNVGTSKQTIGDLFLVDSKGNPVTVDDTVFPTSSTGFVLLSDPADNTVYKIASNSFAVDGAYSGGNANSFGIIDQQSGLYTPFINGLGGASGEAFVSDTPEPATFGLAALALAGLGVFASRKKRTAR